MSRLQTAPPALPSNRFEEQKHPRGGKSENKGEFSSTPGVKGGQTSGQPAGQLAGQSTGQDQSKAVPGQGLPAGQTGGQLAGQTATPEEHAQRHDFTKSQLASVAQPIQGIMSALHAHPDVRSGGSVVEQAVAPNQARQVYAFLGHNVGQSAGGGQAVDLGEGRLGFASPAGSMIVWPADSSGHHQVKYTNQTGLVNRAMGGQGGRPAMPPSPPAGGIASAVPPLPVPPGTAPPVAGVHAPATEPFMRTPPVIAEPPQFAVGAQGKPMSPAAGQAAGALMEKPQAAPGASGPKTPRELAQTTQSQIEAATNQSQQELASGLSPKGNARWRSYIAALGSIHAHQDRLARTDERQQQIAAKAGKGGKDGADGGGLSGFESAAQKRNPQAFKELQAMRDSFKNEAAYQDAAKQLAGQGNAWERRPLLEEPEGGGETQAERNPPIAGGKQPEQWRHAGDAFNKPGAESAAMEKASIDPQSGKPRETKRDIERRLREQARAGFETPAQKQPEPIDGTNPWKSLVKQKAAEWDMQPQDFHSLAKDLHKELSEHLGQREAAKQAARQMSHLSQADINRLENQGFDSGSKHKRIKALDTIGRELASEYPALGWGRGRDEESGEDSGFDYGEHLWDLIREGAKKVPSPTSPEFMEHVEEFLRHQMKSHGSSGVAGGHAAEGEDLSAVPFSKVRKGIVRRYSKWLKSAPRLVLSKV